MFVVRAMSTETTLFLLIGINISLGLFFTVLCGYIAK